MTEQRTTELAIVYVRFRKDRYTTITLTAGDAELYRLNPSTVRDYTGVTVRAVLPGGHDFSIDRGDRYGASMDAAKARVLSDLRDWFKLTWGLDVVIEVQEEP